MKFHSGDGLEMLADSLPAHDLMGSRFSLERGRSSENFHGANPTRYDHLPEDAPPTATPVRYHVKQRQMSFGRGRKPLDVENLAGTGWPAIQSTEVAMKTACRRRKRTSRPFGHLVDCFQSLVAAAESELRMEAWEPVEATMIDGITGDGGPEMEDRSRLAEVGDGSG